MLPKVAAIVYIKGMIPLKAVRFNSNFYGKKPSANGVSISLHRGVVIDNREISVVYQALEMWEILLHVIDTEKLLVCIGC